MTFTYTLTDLVSGATDTGVATVTTVPLTVVAAEAPIYLAGIDETSVKMTFATLPSLSLNVEYSTNLTDWVAHTNNPVNSSATGSLVITFTAPGNQTAPWKKGMFFHAVISQ